MNTVNAAFGPVYSLHVPSGLSLDFMSLGATWLSCRVPLVGGAVRDAVLGCPSRGDYLRQRAYLGATVGRYANRIAQGRFRQLGAAIQLVREAGAAHHLHGGHDGFHRREWRVLEHTTQRLRLAIDSPAGDQGYPGNAQIELTVHLVDALAVEFEIAACVDAPCPLGITQHAYFNLDADVGDVRDHRLRIDADFMLPVDEALLPLGSLKAVEGSTYDFRRIRPVRIDPASVACGPESGEFDTAYLLNARCGAGRSTAAELRASDDRVRLHIATSLPALQLYTGAALRGVPSRTGGDYAAHTGIALEPQFLPDSPNHPEWPQPSCWLMPGETYRHSMRYMFETQ